MQLRPSVGRNGWGAVAVACLFLCAPAAFGQPGGLPVRPAVAQESSAYIPSVLPAGTTGQPAPPEAPPPGASVPPTTVPGNVTPFDPLTRPVPSPAPAPSASPGGTVDGTPLQDRWRNGLRF